MKKIKKELENKINVEKITNVPFDDVLEHSDCSKKYFNTTNNDIIYSRLNEELNVQYLPYLGPCVDFGLGNICLEEGENIFKFYIVDYSSKFDYQEFYKIEEAIERLVNYYRENDLVDDAYVMKKIFFDTLHLEEQKVKKITK